MALSTSAFSFFFRLTCGFAGGRPPLLLWFARQRRPVRLQCLCGMCRMALTPVSRTTPEAFPGGLRPRAAAAPQAPAATIRIPSPAGPPVGLCARRDPQPDGGSARRLQLVVLWDRVVPDLPFVVGVVLLGWVHAAGVRRNLGWNNGDLDQERSFKLKKGPMHGLCHCEEKTKGQREST